MVPNPDRASAPDPVELRREARAEEAPRTHEEAVRNARIMIVDDEPTNVLLLERILRRAGYTRLTGITDSRQVLARVHETGPDLILLDLHMPHLTGNEVLVQLRAELPAGVYLPVLVLSADKLQKARNDALASGAQDFLVKPFDRGEVLLRVRNLLETRLLHLALRGHNERLEEEVRDRTRDLSEALHAAEAASRAKTQFLGNMSHELRTPLTTLRGPLMLVGKLEGERMSARGRQMLEVALRAGARLEKGLLDVLLLFDLQAGAAVPVLSEVDWDALMRELAGEFGPVAAGKGLAFAAHAPAGLAPTHADGARLKEVLRRLVDNAVRFTTAGAITIEVLADEGAATAIRVRDTGPGIPADRIDAVFEAFEQVDNSETRIHQGFGLGLAIARALCTLLGCTLAVESEPGAGSAFSILIPPEQGAAAN